MVAFGGHDNSMARMRHRDADAEERKAIETC
jgi:hypothetical protein